MKLPNLGEGHASPSGYPEASPQSLRTIVRSGAVLVLLCASFVSSPAGTDQTVSSIDDAREGIVKVGWLRREADRTVVEVMGTGFFVSPTGIAVTCAHVLEAIPAGLPYVLITERGNTAPFEIMQIDREVDLAIVKASCTATKYFALSSELLPEVGRAAFFGGVPGGPKELHGLPISFKHCTISDVESHVTPPTGRVVQVIKVDQIVNPGHSGGPLFSDESFAVLGVMRATSNSSTLVEKTTITVPTGYGYAVPLVYLRPYVTNAIVPVLISEPPARNRTARWYKHRLRQEISDHVRDLGVNQQLFEVSVKGNGVPIQPPAELRVVIWYEVRADLSGTSVLGEQLIESLRAYYGAVERVVALQRSREAYRAQIALSNWAALISTHDKELGRMSGELLAAARKLLTDLSE